MAQLYSPGRAFHHKKAKPTHSTMQLYINKPGCSIKVRDGFFIIRPFEEVEQKVPIGKVETLFINRSTHLTAEVAFVAAEFDIDVLFTDRNGQPVARLFGNKFGSISTIRKQQLAFSQSPACVAWVVEVLAEKVDGQAAVVTLLSKYDRSNEHVIQATANKLEEIRIRILETPFLTMEEVAPGLRALEANAAKTYWQCVSGALPPQYTFSGRSRRPAADMFNAMLNYSYGILYGKVETALIRAGIDPYIGIFHRDEHNRPVLVYDVVERFRPWTDFVVISLFRQEVIFVEFFDVEDGAFWLNESGKRILIQTLHDYFEEVTRFNNLDRSRNTHLELYAYGLAALFKAFKNQI